MQAKSRREVLRDLGILAGASVVPVAAKGLVGAPFSESDVAIPPTEDLLVILAGSWVISFDLEDGNLCAITTHNDMHTYDYSVTTNPGSMPQTLNMTGPYNRYNLIVKGSTHAQSPQALVKSMADAGLGLIFNDAVSTDISKKAHHRIVRLPMPTYMKPAAIVHGITVSADAHTVNKPPQNALPTAYVLGYSGWKSARIDSFDGMQNPIPLAHVPGAKTHVRFRICPTGTCDQYPAPPDCGVVSNQETHNRGVFQDLLGLLAISPQYNMPDITFPVCQESGMGPNSGLCFELGQEADSLGIAKGEVGLSGDGKGTCASRAEKDPSQPRDGGRAKRSSTPNNATSQPTDDENRYGQLHNCAASGMIVGA